MVETTMELESWLRKQLEQASLDLLRRVGREAPEQSRSHLPDMVACGRDRFALASVCG